MSEQLLFHEKCNQDVQHILDTFDKEDSEYLNHKKEFLFRLTEAYQLIFESASATTIPVYEMDIHWNKKIPKRIVRVFGFSYFVVYMTLSKKSIVILSVVDAAAIYKYKIKNYPLPD